MTNTIAWKKWNDGGYSVGQSKIHILDENHNCLCGTKIPNEADGYEVGNGYDYGYGTCKRCAKIERKGDK